ncbi:hypothetical protein [Mesorhizobium sp.]|uniref:hypothetical protein n=1 Tax=Mesorhizobium sp. TaxID=1871066 RepID=UPI0025F2F0EF|nr:hypothetical protein [Mesorhizobium sp.]
MAQQFDHAGVAAGRDDIGVDRVARRGFEQQEAADDDDEENEDAADETAAEMVRARVMRASKGWRYAGY